MLHRLFGGPILPTLVKLALASVVVGILLAFFGISPADLLHNVIDTLSHIWYMGFDAIGWALRYFLLGAVVVVPIWLILRLWNVLMERR